MTSALITLIAMLCAEPTLTPKELRECKAYYVLCVTKHKVEKCASMRADFFQSDYERGEIKAHDDFMNALKNSMSGVTVRLYPDTK